MGNFPICYETSEVITYFLIIVARRFCTVSFVLFLSENIVAFAPARYCSGFVEYLLYFCFIVFTLYCFGLVISAYLSIAMFCSHFWCDI